MPSSGKYAEMDLSVIQMKAIFLRQVYVFDVTYVIEGLGRKFLGRFSACLGKEVR